MKKVIYKADSVGGANHGWLDAKHYFSFAGYYDPERVHFGMLRVLNDDTIAPGAGFGSHPHDNMEIVTIPLQGALEHRDSLGSHGVIKPGEVQVMSAGSGITHSEFNHRKDAETKLFQVWIFPDKKDVTPRYDQKDFSGVDKTNRLVTLVSPDGREGSLWIHQNAFFSLGKLEAGKAVDYTLKSKGNGIFLLVVNGEAELAGDFISTRDAATISGAEKIEIKAKSPSEILIIEVPLN